MESRSILHFLHNKTILLTAATGFLAKVFIEKIIRVQPEVKKLYLLIRADDSISAVHRFNTEVLSNELFGRVKEKYGEKLNKIIKEKIKVVKGDISHRELGLDDNVLKELYGQVDVIVNLAATTQFDDRYDVALGINTIGAANVVNFSKKCTELKVLLHVSTAYVCGEKEGIIEETPFKLGESLNGTTGLDINSEKQLVEETLQKLKPDTDIAEAVMKDLGHQRARKYGWPNAYSFTKAMGEMALGQLREDIPVVIMRPTIITSTYKEPFPGWLEGLRNIDSFVVGYGKGKMTFFPGDPQAIIDLIPADMVVNAMIVAMVTHAIEPTDMIVYHVGSSMSNPVQYRRLQLYGYRFFTERPWTDSNSNPILVRKGKELDTVDAVQKYMKIHYLLPLKILSLFNAVSCQYFQRIYLNLYKKIKFLMRLVELFTPYVFFKGVFDDTNTDKLRTIAMEKLVNFETEMFYFDPKRVDWDDYFMYTHIAGVVKYSFKRVSKKKEL